MPYMRTETDKVTVRAQEESLTAKIKREQGMLHITTPLKVVAKEESRTVVIKREQDEMRQSIQKILNTVDVVEPRSDDQKPPPGLDAEPEDVEVVKKKNRNQSAKRKKIVVASATNDEEEDVTGNVMVETGT